MSQVPVGTQIMINRSPYTEPWFNLGEDVPSHTVVGHREGDGWLKIRPLVSPAPAEQVARGECDSYLPPEAALVF